MDEQIFTEHNDLPSYESFDMAYSPTGPFSPTSSEPPLFSSDGPAASDDVSNYDTPRVKRKRQGPWWENEYEEDVHLPKRRIIQSNDEAKQPGQLWLDAERIGPHKTELFENMSRLVENNATCYDLEKAALDGWDLEYIGRLNHVIAPIPDPGMEMPVEGQYRSMVPQLVLKLDDNNIKHLPPVLFSVENLTFLSLRHNCVSYLPSKIRQLKNLESLVLTSNRLGSLPASIFDLMAPPGKLERLDVAQNPFIDNKDASKYSEYLSIYHSRIGANPSLEVGNVLWPLFDGAGKWQKECLWAIAFLQAIEEQKKDSTLLLHERSIAFTPITYYDLAGQLMKGSKPLPEFAKDPFEFVIRTDRGDFASTTVDCVPSASAAPSLVELCLRSALKEESPDKVRRLLSGDLPYAVDKSLAFAEENVVKEFSPALSCDYCSKEYIVPRAAWIDFRVLLYEIVPLKWKVCSWECAREWHGRFGSRRTLDLSGMDE